MDKGELTDILTNLHDKYNCREFVAADPISIPHSFNKKEDIEISGFFSAILAWGKRSQIIKNARLLMQIMDLSPYEYITGATKNDLKRLDKFYYRTYKPVDALFFINVLREMYSAGGMESFFNSHFEKSESIKDCLVALYSLFNSIPHEKRSMKHIANVERGATAKRLNMFLRWMVRKDSRGVDFGLWEKIPSSALYMPIDIHSGRVARELGLLSRSQNDWKAVEELTETLKQFDKADPVKYDFALFGYGVNNA